MNQDSSGDLAARPLTVEETVKTFLERRNFFLSLVDRFGSPLYVIEEATLLARANGFIAAFRNHLPDVQAYFPIKANSHRRVLETVIKAGMGLEVSSGRELELAVTSGARRILFNGPAKTLEELSLALDYQEIVTVIMDSATELERLEMLAGQRGSKSRTGVRLAVETQGLWRKFGIRFPELPGFLEKARRCPHIDLKGLHFHTSWNMEPDAQVQTLIRISRALSALPPETRQGLEFIDIGGGFWPPQGEWQVSPPVENLMEDGPADSPGNRSGPYFTLAPAAPIRAFAEQICRTIKDHLFPLQQYQVYT
ncbi:MAG: alanine racemase, partial [Deltaproteobacteria bacterium]|nr:alanine racemase [Deltaproteobacteria bacterium]